MKQKMLSAALITFLSGAILFSGCASVPKEALDEKEAVIKNLSTQIEILQKEISSRKAQNEELMNRNSALEQKLKEQKETRPVIREAAPAPAEPKIK